MSGVSPTVRTQQQLYDAIGDELYTTPNADVISDIVASIPSIGGGGGGGSGESWKPAHYVGEWEVGTTYGVGDAVRANDSGAQKLYVSLVAGNVGNDPVGDASNWQDVIAADRAVVIEGLADPNSEEVQATEASLYLRNAAELYIFSGGADVGEQWQLAYAPLAVQVVFQAGAIASLQDEINCEHASLDQEATDTTLQTHLELQNNCTAGYQWRFQFLVFLLSDGAAEGVKFSLEGNHALDTFGLNAQVTIYDDTLGTIVKTGLITAFGQAVGAALSAGVNHAVIEGVADISETDNTNIVLQFAQNAAGTGAGVHVQVNSSCIFTRLAQSS